MNKMQSMNRSLVHGVSPIRALDTKGCFTLRRSRRTSVVYAALDSSAAYAVSQQLAAFAAVVGIEAAITGLNTKADVPGRPGVPQTMVGVGGTIASAVLVSQGDFLGTIGCGCGFATSIFLLTYFANRIKETPFNPEDFPGARAWPATMALLSVFSLFAGFQGLMDGLGLLRQA